MIVIGDNPWLGLGLGSDLFDDGHFQFRLELRDGVNSQWLECLHLQYEVTPDSFHTIRVPDYLEYRLLLTTERMFRLGS